MCMQQEMKRKKKNNIVYNDDNAYDYDAYDA